MDQVMLRRPAFTTGRNDLNRVIVSDFAISAVISQFSASTIGFLNRSDYQLCSNVPKFLAAGDDQRQVGAPQCWVRSADEAVFDKRERANLSLSVRKTAAPEIQMIDGKL